MCLQKLALATLADIMLFLATAMKIVIKWGDKQKEEEEDRREINGTKV